MAGGAGLSNERASSSGVAPAIAAEHAEAVPVGGLASWNRTLDVSDPGQACRDPTSRSAAESGGVDRASARMPSKGTVRPGSKACRTRGFTPPPKVNCPPLWDRIRVACFRRGKPRPGSMAGQRDRRPARVAATLSRATPRRTGPSSSARGTIATWVSISGQPVPAQPSRGELVRLQVGCPRALSAVEPVSGRRRPAASSGSARRVRGSLSLRRSGSQHRGLPTEPDRVRSLARASVADSSLLRTARPPA